MSNVENVCPQVLRALAGELRRLAARPPAGVKPLLRDDDLTDVQALIEGPAETPYAGGVFRVRLALGREFPAAPPRAFFLTKIFHPNVSAGGAVCVDTLARGWRPELGLAHALQAVRCLLIAPNADSALNAEAAALLRHHYDDYFARAKLYTDIHARPKPAPASTAAPAPAAAEATPQQAEEGGEGPRAKRERPAAGGAGGAAGAGGAGGAAGAGASGGARGAGGAGGARGAGSAARDRRRILKRL